MRKPIIAGNHKMNLTWQETQDLLLCLKEKMPKQTDVEVIVCPPFTSLSAASMVTRECCIALGAQNMHQAEKGAFTGEISAQMLKASGCDWVILGHSERRHIFNEANTEINAKLKAAIKGGLKPILCVGETLAERQKGQTNAILQSQLEEGLAGIAESDLQQLVIAYEPVWAIGTGQTATPQNANAGCQFIRSLLTTCYGASFAEGTRILYGGSVKPHNIQALMSCSDIDGALVGGASLKCADFNALIRFNE